MSRGTALNDCVLLFAQKIMNRQGSAECVAEGVETEEQLALLRETQYNIVQGFLFYKLLPVEEFEKLLSRTE